MILSVESVSGNISTLNIKRIISIDGSKYEEHTDTKPLEDIYSVLANFSNRLIILESCLADQIMNEQQEEGV